MLSTRPQSIDEVAEANGKHSEYAKMNKQLKGQWKVMEEQHTLLRAVAGSGLEQMNATGQEWERFEQMLDSHQVGDSQGLLYYTPPEHRHCR